MAALLPNEGENFLATFLFSNVNTDRGTGLQLGLFTNSTISETTTYASLTEPTGGGYARIAIADNTWTVTGDTATNTAKLFSVTGTNYTGTVYGYFICTTGTNPKILQIEIDPSGPYDFIVGESYSVTPSITIL